MTNTSLYQAIYDFLNYFFPTELTATTANLNQLLAIISTYALVYFILIRPVVRLLSGRDKK